MPFFYIPILSFLIAIKHFIVFESTYKNDRTKYGYYPLTSQSLRPFYYHELPTNYPHAAEKDIIACNNKCSSYYTIAITLNRVRYTHCHQRFIAGNDF